MANTQEHAQPARAAPARQGARGTTVIKPLSDAYFPDWAELWQFRGLFRALVWRNSKVRYRNMALGAAWSVLQPLLQMTIFTLIFSIWAGIRVTQVPYSVHVLSGLVLMFFINRVVGQAVNLIRSNSGLTNKVYFPKLVLPITLIVSELVDLVIVMLLLMCLMLVNGVAPAPTVLLVPLYLVLLIAWAACLSLWLSALGIRFNDLTAMLPMITMLMTYLSPIIYPITLVPEKYLALYALNPMVGIVTGFRWALFGAEPFYPWMGLITLAEIVVFGVLGLMYFTRTERHFNDYL